VLRRRAGLGLRLISAAVAVGLILSGIGASMLVSVGAAQESGAALLLIESTNGNVVITRADGSSEQAHSGSTLQPGDTLATVGHAEAQVNVGSQASLLLLDKTTLGIRDAAPSGAGGFYFRADMAQGVTVARTLPSKEPTIQISSGSQGAVAMLRQGGMAIATDTGIGNVSVACEGYRDRVYFPYDDQQVDCASGVVRTLTNRGAVEDDTSNNTSFITAAVEAAAFDAERDSDSDKGHNNHVKRDVKEKESTSSAPVVGSPSPFSSPLTP
jgi:hypothetical protein